MNAKRNHAELMELLEAICYGQITPKQARRLESIICEDEQAREDYVQYTHMHANLSQIFSTAQPSPAEAKELKALAAKWLAQGQTISSGEPIGVENFGVISESRSPVLQKLLSKKCSTSTPQLNRWLKIVPTAIAALVLVTLGIVVEKQFGKTSPAPLADRVTTRDTEYVATLKSAAGATWQGSGVPTISGSRLVPGTLRLRSGAAEIEFDSGAVVVIQGPTTLDIQSQDRGFLRSGKLLARVPPPAIGFTIETSSAIVVDHGTEFGIVAGASGTIGSIGTEVHVFEGEVDLAPHSGGVSLAPQRRLVEGDAVRLGVHQDEGETEASYSWRPMASDRNSFSHLGFVVPLQNSTSTFSQRTNSSRLDVKYILDPNPNNGWAIAYNQGSNQTAVVETVTDMGFASGTRLTFVIEQLDDYGFTNLGRFRLSVTTDDRSKFADGLANGGDVTASWKVLEPLGFVSISGATLTKLEDHSLLVSGKNPAVDAYTVSVRTQLTGITGFRIEALTDPSLPSRGPGRHPNGNFVLTTFAVTAAPAGGLHGRGLPDDGNNSKEGR